MRTAALALTFLALIACAEPAEPAGHDPTEHSWMLESGTVDGASIPILETHPVTLEFDEESAGGTAACNEYSGEYRIEGTTIGFDELIQTEMACMPEEVMDSESAYLDALARAAEFLATEERLTLRGEGVELVFTVDEADGS